MLILSGGVDDCGKTQPFEDVTPMQMLEALQRVASHRCKLKELHMPRSLDPGAMLIKTTWIYLRPSGKWRFFVRDPLVKKSKNPGGDDCMLGGGVQPINKS